MIDQLIAKALTFKSSSPTPKLVLIVMAANTNQDSICALNQSQIAAIACCSRKTVTNSIEYFRTYGWVKTQGHTIYMTFPDVETKTVIVSKPPVYTLKQANKTDYSDDFLDWWVVYPRKKNTSKRMAWKAYNKVIASGVVDYHTLMSRTRLYSGLVLDLDPYYVPHPATWLNQERFDTVDDTDYKKRESLNSMAG